MANHVYTFSSLKSAVEHAIGGAFDSTTSSTDVVNDALDYLANAHQWSWLYRALSLNFVASQNYVALPSDFRELHTAQRVGTLRQLRPASLDQIQGWRSTTTLSAPTLHQYFALSMTPQTSVSAVPVWRMELYPTPTSNETGAVIGTYLRIIPKLTSDGDVADIPPHLFRTLKHLCRAMAVSAHTQASGEDWRLANEGIAQAIKLDSAVEYSIGPIRGAVQLDRMETNDYVRGQIVTP